MAQILRNIYTLWKHYCSTRKAIPYLTVAHWMTENQQSCVERKFIFFILLWWNFEVLKSIKSIYLLLLQSPLVAEVPSLSPSRQQNTDRCRLCDLLEVSRETCRILKVYDLHRGQRGQTRLKTGRCPPTFKRMMSSGLYLRPSSFMIWNLSGIWIWEVEKWFHCFNV